MKGFGILTSDIWAARGSADGMAGTILKAN
jgi:hypothetical protein